MSIKRIGRTLIPVALVGVTLALGCAEEDPLVTGHTKTTKATPTPGTGTGTGTEATPSPSPTPTANTSTTVDSEIDTNSTPAPVETLPPNTQPTPAPTPLGAVSEAIVVTGDPKGLAFLSNTVSPWILRSTDVVQMDGNGQLGTPYSTGLSQPSLVAADGAEDLWVVSPGANKIDRLSLGFDGASTAATYTIGANANGLAVDSSEVWISHGGGTLTRITKSSGAIATYTVNGASAIALDSTYAWVAGGANALYRVTRNNGTVSPYTVGSEPIAVAIDGNGTVWTANKAGQSLSKLASGASSPTMVSLSGAPSCLVIDANRVWVGLANQKASYLGLAQAAVDGTVNLPLTPAAAAIDAYGRVWFSDPQSDSVVHVWGR